MTSSSRCSSEIASAARARVSTPGFLTALTFVAVAAASPLAAQQQDPLPGILATMSTLPGAIPTYYPAGALERAQSLQTMLTEGVAFYKERLGIDQQASLALLGPAEWRAVNPQYTVAGGAPYSTMLPGVTRLPGRPPIMVLASERGHALSDVIRRVWPQSPELATLGPSADAVADRYAALVGFHELGHVYTAADSVLPSEGWVNEFLATYLEYAFLRERYPNDARLWDVVSTSLLNHLQPKQTSLAQMHGGGGGGPDTYVWYQSSLQTRIREVYDAQRLDFYQRVRSRRAEIGPGGKSPVINTLEQIAPGFLAWQARYHSGDTTSPTRPSTPQRTTAPLTDFEGEFAYHGTSHIVLVARDSLLFAVLDDARYPLRPLGDDRFLNAGGDTIPFRRGSDGAVSAFVEKGVVFARLTPRVDPDVVAAVRAHPRPLGADGRPAPYVYARPVETDDGLRSADAATAGLDTGTLARIVARVADGTYPDLHSLLVWRHGRLVAEEYFYEYDRDRPHQMRSATKSVVSALVGIAIDRGLLASDTERVMPRLPYAAYANADARKNGLTLRDLLTMRSGLACDDWNGESPGNESRMYQSPDWPKFVLDLPMIDAPGTKGSYCSGNVAVAGRIVERASSMPLPSLAQQYLFDPLGIRARELRWNYALTSSNAATFAQIYLRPRDMLKLGILFHQHGMWNGRQIISREWVERSTAKWSHVGDQDYGYFWWHQWIDVPTPTGTQRVDMVLATGNGGQKIYVIPSLDAVVVMTGGNYNTNSPSTAIMRQELLPAMLRGASTRRG